MVLRFQKMFDKWPIPKQEVWKALHHRSPTEFSKFDENNKIVHILGKKNAINFQIFAKDTYLLKKLIESNNGQISLKIHVYFTDQTVK